MRRTLRSSSSCHCLIVSAGASAANPVVNRSTTSTKRSGAMSGYSLPWVSLHLEHRAELHRKAHVPFDLELARHEEHLARLLAREHVEPVLGRDLQGQIRVRARAGLDRARAVLDHGVPGAAAVAAHVVLDHRVGPGGLVGPEPRSDRVEGLSLWASCPPVRVDFYF